MFKILLIVPEGIEMCKRIIETFQLIILLIVPEGIEIMMLGGYVRTLTFF